jgi:hypothetical protein
MRFVRFVVIAMVGLSLAASAAMAQSDEAVSGSQKKVFGYQDPKTGVFHQLGNREVLEPDVTTAPTTGTVDVVVTITLKTALPKGGSIVCDASLIASSISETTASVATYEEALAEVATVSGSTATCTIKIPYSWALPAASTTVVNAMDGNVDVIMSAAPTTATPAAGLFSRSSLHSFAQNAKIPAAGATTSYAVAVTL